MPDGLNQSRLRVFEADPFEPQGGAGVQGCSGADTAEKFPGLRPHAQVRKVPADIVLEAGLVDDGAARRDWGFAPKHDLDSAFSDYLLPRIRARYDG